MPKNGKATELSLLFTLLILFLRVLLVVNSNLFVDCLEEVGAPRVRDSFFDFGDEPSTPAVTSFYIFE